MDLCCIHGSTERWSGCGHPWGLFICYRWIRWHFQPQYFRYVMTPQPCYGQTCILCSGHPVYYGHRTTSQTVHCLYIFCKADLYTCLAVTLYITVILPFPKVHLDCMTMYSSLNPGWVVQSWDTIIQVTAKFEFRYDSLKNKLSLILFAYNLLIGHALKWVEKVRQENAFDKDKKTRVNANCLSNRWALGNKINSFKVRCHLYPSLAVYLCESWILNVRVGPENAFDKDKKKNRVNANCLSNRWALGNKMMPQMAPVYLPLEMFWVAITSHPIFDYSSNCLNFDKIYFVTQLL